MTRYVRRFLSDRTAAMPNGEPMEVWIGFDFEHIEEIALLRAGFEPAASFPDHWIEAQGIKDWPRVTPFQKGALRRLGIQSCHFRS